jgi:aspartyl/asparaginyl-tRNA synthetase
VFDGLFGHIFDQIKANYGPELEAIRKQYPFEDLKYTNPMKRLTHREAVNVLRAWGEKAMPGLKERTPGWMIPYLEWDIKIASLDSDEEEPDCTLPELTDAQKVEVRQFSDDWVTTGQCINMGYMDDFTTPCEKQLGRNMHAEHDSDFYIVDKFPLCVRPFYTMPDPNDPEYHLRNIRMALPKSWID